MKISLKRNAMWYPPLGVFDRDNLDFTGEEHQLLPPDTITRQPPYGEVYRLAPPVSDGLQVDTLVQPRMLLFISKCPD